MVSQPKPRRKFLGCGCLPWSLIALALLALIVVANLSAGSRNAQRDQPGNSVPTFTPTSAPTSTALPLPTATAVPIVLPSATPQPARAEEIVIPALPDASLSDCPCNDDVKNCADFAPFDAQSCYLRCKQLTGLDVHHLDRDADGNACEWSP